MTEPDVMALTMASSPGHKPPRDATPLDILESVSAIAALRVAFCLWKSVDRLEEGLDARTDLDLLVAPEGQDLILRHLGDTGWFRVEAEPWRRFRDVLDFVAYDSGRRRFAHLHVHFRLVMGEKLIKSLSPPLEELYFSSAQLARGVPCAPAELEFVVFILRLCAKLTLRDWLRALRRGKAVAPSLSLLDEYAGLRARCTSPALERILAAPQLEFVDSRIILDAFEDLQTLGAARQRRLLTSLTPYRRYGATKRLVLRAWRTWLRRRVGVGKTLSHRAPMIAVCGADGSGKTTLVAELKSRLGQQLHVRRFYMGNSVAHLSAARRIFRIGAGRMHGRVARTLEQIGLEKAGHWVRAIYREIDEYLLAREKGTRYRRGAALAAAGGIALYERFPLFAGGGDGLPEARPSRLWRRQRSLFRQIAVPDLLFVLDLPAELAVQRKPEHDAAVVCAKVERFRRFVDDSAGSNGVVRLDAALPAELLADAAMSHIVERLTVAD